MKKLLSVGLVATMAVCLLAGCSGGKGSTGGGYTETGKQAAAPAGETTPGKGTTAAGGGQTGAAKVDRSQQLIIYTNSGSNGRDVWLKDRAAKEGFHIQVVQIQGGDLANRLIAEKNNSQADLVFGLNALEYEKLKKQDLLLKYKPAWADQVDMSLGDPDGYYYPIVVQPLVVMYNNQMKDAPKDYTDLLDPKYKDKYTILNFGGGTGKTILASILSRYPDPKGQYGISDEGWKVVKQWIQNGHMEVQGEDYVGDVISGKRPMCEMWGSGVLQNQKERNYQFGIMCPEIGVPYVVEQTAIISKTKKADLAQDFINWFGTAQVQQEWSQQFGTIPAQPEALKAASQDVKDFMAKVHSQKMDWKLISDNIDKWVEKAELEYVE